MAVGVTLGVQRHSLSSKAGAILEFIPIPFMPDTVSVHTEATPEAQPTSQR